MGHRVQTRRRRNKLRDTVPTDRPTLDRPSWSGIMHRTVDPTIVRQIKEIDEALVVEWLAFGQWWIGDRPQAATLGCWRIGVRGRSGAVRWLRMWPPECADGRLIYFLTEFWKRRIFVLNSMRPDQWKREQMDDLKRRQDAEKHGKWDAWWNTIDHAEMHRAIKAQHESPKWRGSWNVPVGVT